MKPRWLRKRPQLAHVDVLRLQPGDVIVARTAQRLTAELAEAIKARLEQKLPGYRALVMDDKTSLSVLRQTQHLDSFTVNVDAPGRQFIGDVVREVDRYLRTDPRR